MKMIRFAITCLLLMFAAVGAAFAAGDDEIVDVRVLPGWRMSNGNHVAALEMTLKDGWKTYWRAPGDSGIPPRFSWGQSGNVHNIEINWPTPKLFSTSGVTSIGYDRVLILPLTVTPERPGEPVRLVGQVDIGVCEEICVPMSLKISQVLTAASTRPDYRIVAALAERPYSPDEAGVRRVVCHLSAAQDGLRLRAEIDLPAVGRNEIAVVETDNPGIWVANVRTRRQGGRLVAETELYQSEGLAFALNRSGLRITVLGGAGRAVDIQGCPAG